MKTYTNFWMARNPSKGSVLVVHGAGEHIDRYQWAISRWNSSGYHVFGGDLPGYGRSEGKKGHIDRFEDYIDMVDSWYLALYEQSEHLPFVFGHSFGGLITARFMETKERKVSGVIFSSPCFGLTTKVPSWKKWMAHALNVLYPSLVLASGIQGSQVTRNQELAEFYSKDPLNTAGVSVRWYRELIAQLEKNWSHIHRFPHVPVLVEQAGDDRVVDAARVREWSERLHVKDKTYKEWPGLYHELLNEPEKEEVMNHILQWMEIRSRIKPKQ